MNTYIQIMVLFGLSYFGVIFILALISFIADHITKDERQRYEEYWRDKNTDTK
jgi:thiol:disulfide interchange protein